MPDISLPLLLFFPLFVSTCFYSAPSWQPSSAVTRQHRWQLLLNPFLCLLFSFHHKRYCFVRSRLKVFHHLHLCDVPSEAVTRDYVVIGLFLTRSPFGPFDLQVDTSFGATTCIRPLETTSFFFFFQNLPDTYLHHAHYQPRVSDSICLFDHCLEQGLIPQGPAF